MTMQHAAGIVPEFTLGDRLRKAREMTGLTIRQFADEIGVGHGTITNAEGGLRRVRPITIRAYAMRTGVSFEWLANGSVPEGTKGGPDGDMAARHARTDV